MFFLLVFDGTNNATRTPDWRVAARKLTKPVKCLELMNVLTYSGSLTLLMIRIRTAEKCFRTWEFQFLRELLARLLTKEATREWVRRPSLAIPLFSSRQSSCAGNGQESSAIVKRNAKHPWDWFKFNCQKLLLHLRAPFKPEKLTYERGGGRSPRSLSCH
jgi:hypothetical protein